MTIFSLKDLTFCYEGSQTPALSNVNLEIRRGSLVLVCGQNGCGKTTLLKHLKSSLRPKGKSSGMVLYNGTPLDEVSAYTQASEIGYSAQNPCSQLGSGSVWDEIASGLKAVDCDEHAMRSRVAEMSSFFGIDDWSGARTSELSQGQKQLLTLAAACALNPKVLVFDAPISQLDPLTASDFLASLRRLNVELGITVIITDHKLEEVYRLADKVVVLDHGKVLFEGSPRLVAKQVYESTDQMKYALPVTIRLYHGLRPNADLADAPLTIREMREWFNEEARGKEISIRHLPDKRAGSLNDPPILEFKDVSFKYGKSARDVLSHLDLSIGRGSIHALVGSNGSGKSTAMKIAAGLLSPYSGSVKLNGVNVRRINGNELRQQGIGMLPQALSKVFSRKTVREELAEVLEFEHLSPEELDYRVKDTALSVGVIDLLDRNPAELSIGERQLVAIGKMLMRRLKVVLFDEPTKNVDALSKRKIARALHEFTVHGSTVVLSSHDVEFCAKYATAISMLFKGAALLTDTPQAFYSSNIFYTTTASRISRELFTNTVTDEEVFILCQENGI